VHLVGSYYVYGYAIEELQFWLLLYGCETWSLILWEVAARCWNLSWPTAFKTDYTCLHTLFEVL